MFGAKRGCFLLPAPPIRKGMLRPNTRRRGKACRDPKEILQKVMGAPSRQAPYAPGRFLRRQTGKTAASAALAGSGQENRSRAIRFWIHRGGKPKSAILYGLPRRFEPALHPRSWGSTAQRRKCGNWGCNTRQTTAGTPYGWQRGFKSALSCLAKPGLPGRPLSISVGCVDGGPRNALQLPPFRSCFLMRIRLLFVPRSLFPRFP